MLIFGKSKENLFTKTFKLKGRLEWATNSINIKFINEIEIEK